MNKTIEQEMLFSSLSLRPLLLKTPMRTQVFYSLGSLFGERKLPARIGRQLGRNGQMECRSFAWSYDLVGVAQYQYSLVNREIEAELCDLCPSEGIGITAWGPLGGGFLSGKYQRNKRSQVATEGRIATTGGDTEEAWERRNTERNWVVLETVQDIAQVYSATIAQIALAWLRMQPIVSSVILGIRTLSQLEENLPAATLELTAEERCRLDRVSTPPERYPYRLIELWRQR